MAIPYMKRILKIKEYLNAFFMSATPLYIKEIILNDKNKDTLYKTELNFFTKYINGMNKMMKN